MTLSRITLLAAATLAAASAGVQPAGKLMHVGMASTVPADRGRGGKP